MLLGFVVGYSIGGVKRLSIQDRIIIGLSFILLGGSIVILTIGAFVDVGTFEVLLSIISTAGGFGLGIASNWEPPDVPPPRPKIVFDPEEADEEFDRQLNEALGLKENDT